MKNDDLDVLKQIAQDALDGSFWKDGKARSIYNVCAHYHKRHPDSYWNVLDPYGVRSFKFTGKHLPTLRAAFKKILGVETERKHWGSFLNSRGYELCSRCGGAGGYAGWPGFYCYDCGGRGFLIKEEREL